MDYPSQVFVFILFFTSQAFADAECDPQSMISLHQALVANEAREKVLKAANDRNLMFPQVENGILAGTTAMGLLNGKHIAALAKFSTRGEAKDLAKLGNSAHGANRVGRKIRVGDAGKVIDTNLNTLPSKMDQVIDIVVRSRSASSPSNLKSVPSHKISKKQRVESIGHFFSSSSAKDVSKVEDVAGNILESLKSTKLRDKSRDFIATIRKNPKMTKQERDLLAATFKVEIRNIMQANLRRIPGLEEPMTRAEFQRIKGTDLKFEEGTSRASYLADLFLKIDGSNLVAGHQLNGRAFMRNVREETVDRMLRVFQQP